MPSAPPAAPPAAPLQPALFDDVRPPALGRRGNVLVGTCSWTDPSLIRSKAFYPRGTGTAEKRLRYYATQFPIVEVDSSYFALPDPANAARWAERTPPGFVFNVKAFRLFTGHQTPPEAFPPDLQPLLPPLAGRKRNRYWADVPAEIRDELWRRYLDAVAPLAEAGKLGALHFQFAPWVTSAPEWRAHVEDCVARLPGRRVAVEFRNTSWLDEAHVERTLAWERELGVVHVVVDEPQGVGQYAQPVWAVTNPALAIVRLHGRNAETWTGQGLAASSDRFNYEYPDEELQDLAERMHRLADEAFELQALVNVNFEDQGVRAAQRLQDMLGRLGTPPAGA